MGYSKEELGKRIRHFREEAGLSQSELAAKAGYKSKVSISKIEAGLARVPAYKLIDISKALNVMITEFLEGAPSSLDQPEALPEIEVTDVENNSADKLQHIMLILSQMNDKQIEKAESILSTIFEE